MEGIKLDERNYRVHDEKNKSLINKSLSELGAGRSILLDNSGKIIAGNGVFGEWGDKPVRIIETDGSELIAVKRKDLSPDDPRRQQLAFADNHTSDTSEFDKMLLSEDWKILQLEEWGVDFSSEDFSGKNKELNSESLEETIELKLNFKLATYEKVISSLYSIDIIPENAILKLLGINE